MRLRNVKNKEEILNNSKLLVRNYEDYKGNWNKLFGNKNPLYIEIGMGKGQFILENALRYPNINFIGIERLDSVLALAIKKIEVNDELPNNLKLIRIDAKNIDQAFSHDVDRIYLNFSDPWPKERHAKRRLTSPEYLAIYDNLFKGKPHIIQKTDNDNLFAYSLEQFLLYGYTINIVSYDLHNEDIVNVETEYEEKFSKLGIKIKYVDVSK
jgi:tRNA (guanine-N7-)-methyltransferase